MNATTRWFWYVHPLVVVCFVLCALIPSRPTAASQAPIAPAQANTEGWSALGPGTDMYGYAIAVVDGDVFVGGSTFATPPKLLTRWDGGAWTYIDTPFDTIASASITQLIAIGSDLYAVANDTHGVAHVARYNTR